MGTSNHKFKIGKEVSDEGLPSGGSKLKEVIVQDKAQITGALLSDVVYVLDGSFTFVTGESIEVPANGLTLAGMGFDISQLNKNVAGESLFTSPVGGSGNLILKDAQFYSGAGKVFDIVDSDGSHAIEFNDINFSGCSSLGDLDGYRQFTGTTCGIYGCSNGFTLHNAWNGFKLVNTNCFGFGASGTLFKAGTNLQFSNRFYISMNIDIPAGALLTDFSESNFAENELFQINSTIAKVSGVLDDINADTIIPNIKANNLKSLWRSNVGLPDSADEKMVNDDNVSGTYVIDWLKDTYVLTLIGDTVFSEKNLPANLKNTGEVKIYLSGDFTPTFINDWLTNSVGTFKKGEINEITLKFLKTGVYFMKIDNSLTIYPAPDLNNVDPVWIQPDSQNNVLTLNGSFFTPATIVEIEDQVITSQEFVNSGKIVLGLNAGSVEKEIYIKISNGTEKLFEGYLLVSLGEVTIPSEVDWTIMSGAPNVEDMGAIRIVGEGQGGTANVFSIAPTEDFQIRFKLKTNPLSTGAYAGTRKAPIRLNQDGVQTHEMQVYRNGTYRTDNKLSIHDATSGYSWNVGYGGSIAPVAFDGQREFYIEKIGQQVWLKETGEAAVKGPCTDLINLSGGNITIEFTVDSFDYVGIKKVKTN